VSAGGGTAFKEDDRERAFLIGVDIRTRGRRGRGTVTAQAQAARDAAATAGIKTGPQSSAQSAGKSANKPVIPEFDAEESLAELRTLAGSAGANVVGEILQRRDRPEPATLIGTGKLEEIRSAVEVNEAELVLFNHALRPIRSATSNAS